MPEAERKAAVAKKLKRVAKYKCAVCNKPCRRNQTRSAISAVAIARQQGAHQRATPLAEIVTSYTWPRESNAASAEKVVLATDSLTAFRCVDPVSRSTKARQKKSAQDAMK
jgi:hypothetical protein